MELYSSGLKKFLIFSQKKAVPKKETPKKFHVFKETELSYISGNGKPKKFLIFQKGTCKTPKTNKKSALK